MPRKDPIKLARSSNNWDRNNIFLNKIFSKILDILIKPKKPILVEKPVSIGSRLKKFSILKVCKCWF